MRLRLALPLALVLAACGDSAPAGDPGSPPPDAAPVLATTLPLETIAERLLDGDPPVRGLVPAGERVDRWRPDRAALADVRNAALVLTNGAGLEPWLDTVSLPSSRVVDASAGFAESWIPRDELAHTHGLGGERSPPPPDPYVWLDLDLLALQVVAVRDAFARRWPDRAGELEERARALTDELARLDARLASLRVDGAPPRLLAAAPVYAYLGRAHGWSVRAIDPADAAAALEGGRAPVLLWLRPPNPAAAEFLAEDHGVRSVVFSPGLELSAEQRARGVDYLDLLEAGLTALEEAFGE